MRGLPQPPDTVARCEYTFDHAGATSTCNFWAFLPELPTALFTDVQAWFSDFSFAALTLFNKTSTTNTACTAGRLTTYGAAPLSLFTPFTATSGAWSGSTPNNCAVGLYFGTSDRGKRGHAVVHVPGFPNEFTDNELTLNEHGWTVTEAALETFVPTVNALSHGTLLSTALCTVRKQQLAAPLPAALVSLVTFSRPVLKIASINRRLYAHRGFPRS